MNLRSARPVCSGRVSFLPRSPRLATDGQSVDAQMRQLTKTGCTKVFCEVARRAKADRAQLRRLFGQLEAAAC